MKTKKIIPIFALTACIVALSGCTDVDHTLSFSNYWNENSLVNTSIHETLVYDVTYEKDSGLSAVNYSLAYSNGKYTTQLISDTYNGQSIYVYKTELAITVSYTYNGESADFNDSVVTETRFLTAENALRPLSSTKTVTSASPSMGSATKLSDCYTVYNYAVTTQYKEDGSGGNCTTVMNPGAENELQQTADFEIESKYTYLDNEQLFFALRGLPTSKTTGNVYAYSPFVDKVQTVKFTFSSEASAEFSFFKNGSAEKTTSAITYRPVSVVLNEQYPGGTQTAWIAKPADASVNTNRNILLRLETPISYALGSLVYTLNSVTYQ